MTTRLDKTLKREITVGDQVLTVTLSAEGFTLVPKGHRNGKTFKWASLWSGEAELAAQLHASVAGHEPKDTSGDHS
jgi:hypothetical protein